MCPHKEEIGEERSFRERSRQDRVLYRISPRIASKDRCKPVAVGSLLSESGEKQRGREAEKQQQKRPAPPHSMRTINIGPYL